MTTVITGKNTFEVADRQRRIVADFLQESGGSIERFDGSELTGSDAVLDAVRSISFLEPHKLILVRDFAQNKELLDRIESIVEAVADANKLLLVDQKLDKRSSAYKYLQKNTELIDCKEPDPRDMQSWAQEYAKTCGIQLDRALASHLVDRIGSDQQRLASEIVKLSLVPSKSIDKALIDDMTDPSPQSKIFDLLDALFQGRSAQAWQYYTDQRAQGVDPQQIIAMLVWQLQQLALAVNADGSSADVLIRAGMSPFSARKAQSLASRMSKQDVLYMVSTLSEVDQAIKTSADAESALEVFFAAVVERQNA